jgi:hypothetical protein
MQPGFALDGCMPGMGRRPGGPAQAEGGEKRLQGRRFGGFRPRHYAIPPGPLSNLKLFVKAPSKGLCAKPGGLVSVLRGPCPPWRAPRRIRPFQKGQRRIQAFWPPACLYGKGLTDLQPDRAPEAWSIVPAGCMPLGFRPQDFCPQGSAAGFLPAGFRPSLGAVCAEPLQGAFSCRARQARGRWIWAWAVRGSACAKAGDGVSADPPGLEAGAGVQKEDG